MSEVTLVTGEADPDLREGWYAQGGVSAPADFSRRLGRHTRDQR